MNTITIFQISPPPPIPPPPPPGLPIDDGILLLAFAGGLLGSLVMLTVHQLEKNNLDKKPNTFGIYVFSKLLKIKLLRWLIQTKTKTLNLMNKLSFILILFLLTQKTQAQITAVEIMDSKHDTWAIGGGVSNLIMHGDLRSVGTGDLGNFWNFGGYLYVDKMFNPLLGLEFKLNYNKISGGAQYFSDVYDVLYINNTTINNNLFFEGRAYGAELSSILSFSNLFKRNQKKWHLAGYLGVGYHLYNSKLYEKQSSGSNIVLIDFGNNPARNNTKEASSIYLTVQLGLKYKLSKRIDLEFRPSWYFNNEDHLDAVISNKQDWESFFITHVGLTIKLGNQETYSIWDHTYESDQFVLRDTDLDGVIDEFDIEPNTPSGARVYGNGQAIDSDLDGLPDYKDKCPFKKGVTDNLGCPNLIDSDKDGVVDNEDLCPLEPGTILMKGCLKSKEEKNTKLIQYVYNLAANVYFDSGKWTLTETSKEVLNQMANYIGELPKIKFRVEGHTDNRDRDQHNLLLSQKRADAVRKYLIRRGVSSNRLSSTGMGESQPKYSNETSKGRLLNRRVEVKVENTLEEIPIDKVQKNPENGIHIVEENDTLYSISLQYNISVNQLKSLNGLTENTLKIGQKLKIK